ncbi:MAG: anaerobic ribonucleoside-triphosphate reductase activating protein [Muribaculaceae bacterium]
MSENDDIKLRVVDIVDGTSVDGPGLRTSIYFAGCDHRCPGCHNPSTWPHDAGRDMSISEIIARIDDNGFNVTFSGGDPLYQADKVAVLAEEIKRRLGKTVWCYTGFTYDELAEGPEDVRRLLRAVDVLVDGPFVEALRDTSLLFRGSANQRLIDVRATVEAGHIVDWTRK